MLGNVVMKHVRVTGDTNLQAPFATYYVEVDPSGMVVRQVQVAGTTYLWGEFDGEKLVGCIADQPFVDDELAGTDATRINVAEFEQIWRRAKLASPDPETAGSNDKTS